MRANILFCLCFFMGLVTQLNAQITITGKVIDEQQQLIPYANVVLLSLGMLLFIAFGIAGIQLLELFVSLQIHRC